MNYRARFIRKLVACVIIATAAPLVVADSFVNFESGHVRPLSLSPDGSQLFAVNTPDNRLEIYDVTAAGLSFAGDVNVGLEPVAIASRVNPAGATEVWVVNHLSDSVSIVEVDPVSADRSRVTRTLLVGDEPRDIVFSGSAGNRAFITAAHRGQNRPGDPQLTTEGVGRADVWVFDTDFQGAALGGTPLTILELFGDTPRALATSDDGSTVYAAVFMSGNRTASVTATRVEDDGGAPSVDPTVTQDPAITGSAPATGLIVEYDGINWVDEQGNNWSDAVPFSLPDLDVFRIDANANPPVAVSGSSGSISGVGTVLFNMAVRPTNGNVYVSNIESRNHVRFEPALAGNNVLNQVSVINGSTVAQHHLNPHIDYSVPAGPLSEIEQSLAQPMGLVFSSDGAMLFVAGFGSGKVGVFDAAALESGSIVKDLIAVGDGPSGLAIDEVNDRLYVMNRISHDISVVSNLSTPEIRGETSRIPLRFNPEPAEVQAGRIFLYDARNTSGHGDNSCGLCHIFGDMDGLAWDLGNPGGSVIPNLIPRNNTGVPTIDFHPMKGPMTTQSLRGLAGAGAMHWRGDRNGAANPDGTVIPGGDPFDEEAGFKQFNGAFVDLQGRAQELADEEMQAFTDFVLTLAYPPNPVKALDNTDSAAEARGRDLFHNETAFGSIFPGDGIGIPCQQCHALPLTTTGEVALAGLTPGVQEMKIPHLRNQYQKVGRFGIAANSIPSFFLRPNQTLSPNIVGDQVRGFGFAHDGAVSTIFDFLQNSTFEMTTQDARDLEAFLLAMDTGLPPIVGQQITLTDTTWSDAELNARLQLMQERADAGDCDLVAKGIVDDKQRGFLYIGSGTYRTDEFSAANLSKSDLIEVSKVSGQELTLTCVPAGSGQRIALDRDGDQIFDGDEANSGSDPADPLSLPPGC